MIAVRVATADDQAVAQAVFDAAFAPIRSKIYRPSPQQIHDALEHRPQHTRLVAVEDNAAVGTVLYRIDGDRLRLRALAVLPKQQRRGVARVLVEHMAEIASANRCAALALYTVKQTGNVAVFRRLGFEEIWERPDASSQSLTGSELTEVYMERAIGKGLP